MRRRELCPEVVAKAAKEVLKQGEEAGERFARGLFPEVTQAWMEPHERQDKEEVIWIKRPAAGFFHGNIFVDGSASDPEAEVLRRAGWSIVMYSEGWQLLGAVCGTVPLSWAPLQLARDGEDYAFHFLSGCATSPLEVYSDCAGSITCAVGVGKALAKGAARGHLWHRWWQELGGLEEVYGTKVKAHRAKAECSTEEERWTREGNEEADHYAKMGARAWKPRP